MKRFLLKKSTRLGGRKKAGDDAVSRIKNFEFNAKVPGISQNSGESGGAAPRIKQALKKMRSQKAGDGIASIKKKGLRLAIMLVAVTCLVFVGEKTGIHATARSALESVRYFHLKNLEITGCQVTSKEEIRRRAGVDFMTSLLLLDKSTIQEKIEASPWVKSAEIDIGWPGDLFIKIREHTPEALISLGEPDNQQLYYVARTGLPFAPVGPGDELDYPVITGFVSAEQVTGEKETLKDVFTFLKQAKRNNPRLPIQAISEIHVNERQEMVVYLVEHPFPIYMGKGEMKTKYRQLLDVLGVLYKKHRKGAKIARVESIRLDYYDGKVLVSLND